MGSAFEGQNSIARIYKRHFPEVKQKLYPGDIKQAEDFLERAFSDDVRVTVFLPMVEEEESVPTFELPPNWSQLSSKAKADLIVINNMIKLFF